MTRHATAKRRQQQLRNAAWTVVVLAVVMALQPGTSTGSRRIGLVLAGVLALWLYATKKAGRKAGNAGHNTHRNHRNAGRNAAWRGIKAGAVRRGKK